MKNFLTKHLKSNKETYFSHLKFALTISLEFLYRSLFFLVHGVLPFIPVPKGANITKTYEWLKKLKEYTDSRNTN